MDIGVPKMSFEFSKQGHLGQLESKQFRYYYYNSMVYYPRKPRMNGITKEYHWNSEPLASQPNQQNELAESLRIKVTW